MTRTVERLCAGTNIPRLQLIFQSPSISQWTDRHLGLDAIRLDPDQFPLAVWFYGGLYYARPQKLTLAHFSNRTYLPGAK